MSLAEAIALLVDENLANIFVVEGDRFLGRFSQRDALRLLRDPPVRSQPNPRLFNGPSPGPTLPATEPSP